MSDPSIPALALLNGQSAVGIENQDTYGLHFAIQASEDWVYVPDGESPDYDAEIVIAILVGDDEDALCASQSTAHHINFSPDSAGNWDSQSKTYRWVVTITADAPDPIISKGTPLVIDMSNIRPNDKAGVATITLLPRLKAQPGTGKTDIVGTPMSYRVEKTTPPIVIDNVRWSRDGKPGRGSLTWRATGEIRSCTVQVNGENVGTYPRSASSNYEAKDLILEMGSRFVTITATDQNNNTATYTYAPGFPAPDLYFPLLVGKGRPLSLVQSDQNAFIYAVFSTDGSSAEIWQNGQNDQSGTQDNWQNLHLALEVGYETSPCVRYNDNFYLVGGSSFDPDGFQNNFLIYQKGHWNTAAQIPWEEPRIGHAVTLFEEAIWVAGGYGASGTVYDDVYSYSQITGTWTSRPKLPLPLCNASLAVAGDALYLFGGYRDMPGGVPETELHLFSGDSWKNQQKMLSDPPPKADYWALGSVGSTLLLLGRFDGKAFTGQMSATAKYWQSAGGDFASVALPAGAQPPYGFTTCAFAARRGPLLLFLIMTDTAGHSAFAYYAPAEASSEPEAR